MNRAGALELLMPVVQPAELWQESGRWDQYGPSCCASRTATSAISARPDARGSDHRHRAQGDAELPPAAGQPLSDPDQVPRRDPAALRRHARREFMMKDAYSFDADNDGLMRAIAAMYDAYARIFTRLGLKFRAVAADTGAIGGTGRTNSRCSPTPAKTRSPSARRPTTRPTSSWPKRVAPARSRAAPRASRWRRCRRRARPRARRSPRCWSCRSATVKCIVLHGRRAACTCCCCAATTC